MQKLVHVLQFSLYDLILKDRFKVYMALLNDDCSVIFPKKSKITSYSNHQQQICPRNSHHLSNMHALLGY
jgi:hypothetical protein